MTRSDPIISRLRRKVEAVWGAKWIVGAPFGLPCQTAALQVPEVEPTAREQRRRDAWLPRDHPGGRNVGNSAQAFGQSFASKLNRPGIGQRDRRLGCQGGGDHSSGGAGTTEPA